MVGEAGGIEARTSGVAVGVGVVPGAGLGAPDELPRIVVIVVAVPPPVSPPHEAKAIASAQLAAARAIPVPCLDIGHTPTPFHVALALRISARNGMMES
jgi:hypothetical protein